MFDAHILIIGSSMDEDHKVLYEQVSNIYERYLGVNLSYEVFVKPDSNTFVSILIVMLKHLDIDVDSLSHPQVQNSLLFSANLDHYSSAISQINIFLLTKYVLGIIDESIEFSLFDMVRPKFDRLLPIYELIAQLVLYKDKTDEIFESSFSQISEFKSQITGIHDRVNDLKLSLPHQRNEILMNEEVITKYSQKLSELKNIFDNKTLEKQEISEQVKDNESTRQDLLLKIESNETKIKESISQLDKLKDSIVPYPDEFQKEFNSVKKDMDSLMDSLIKKGHDIDNKRSELLKYVGLENELKAVDVNIKKIQELNEKIIELSSWRNSPAEMLNNAENSYQELQKCKNKLIDNIKCKKKYLDELEHSLRKRFDNEEKEFHEAKKLEYSLTCCLDELNDKKYQLNNEIESIEQQRHTAIAESQKTKELILEKFQALLSKMEKFNISKTNYQYYNFDGERDDSQKLDYSQLNIK